MSSSDILKIYGSMNCLLIVGYLIFYIFKKLNVKFGHQIGFRSSIQLAKILIAAAVVAPIAFHQLPQKTFPQIEWGEFVSIPDEIVKASSLRIQKVSQSVVVNETDRRPVEPGFISVLWNNKMTLLLTLLLLGFCFMLSRFVWNAWKINKLISSSVVIRKFGKVHVALSSSISIPFSVQLLQKRWVVLPETLLENNIDFKIALKHELQHHRQRDTWWAFVMELIICFFFPNPSIYLWKTEIIELQEFSCDESLIGQKGISSYDYGSCLLRVSEAALGSRQMYVGTTCMAAISQDPNNNKSFLRRRIEMFTSQKKPRTYRWAGALVGTIAVTLTLAAAFGAEQALRSKVQTEPNPGSVIVDPDIQGIAEKALAEAIKSQKAKGGFAIVADPTSGKILAVANIDTTGKKTGYWSLSQVLEPASQAKVIVAAQAIESGLTGLQDYHSCENGTYKFGNDFFHDWKVGGWERLTTEGTIMVSSDICSIKIGELVGAQALQKMLVQFGFGPGGSAESFPAAMPGFLPGKTDNRKVIPQITAGFGFKATPIEMVQAYGAIANGGKLLKPQLANSTNGVETIRQVMTKENAEKVKEILRQVVLKGTGKPAQSSLYSMAGKTATSYVPDLTKWNLVEGRKKGNYAAFIGFAPVKDPKVEVYVGIHEPNTDGTGAHGGEHAAPVFKRIAEEVLKHMNVPADVKAL
jgi:beta-lactamase regulating signal transducer with metallopeptidase domain